MKAYALAAAFGLAVLAMPAGIHAQGIVRGAEQGAAVGNRAAGPVGGAVGGAVGGVTGGVVGGVKGVLGIPQNTGTVQRHRSDRYSGRDCAWRVSAPRRWPLSTSRTGARCSWRLAGRAAARARQAGRRRNPRSCSRTQTSRPNSAIVQRSGVLCAGGLHDDDARDHGGRAREAHCERLPPMVW